MTKWYNFKVTFESTDIPEDFIEEIEDKGAKIYGTGEDYLKFGSNYDDIDFDSIKQLVREYSERILVFTYVTANDTDDSAQGKKYEVDDHGELERVYSRGCGPSERRNWSGIDGVNGGKYF